VRELKNLLERLVIMIADNIIDAKDIPPPYNPAAEKRVKKDDLQLLSIDSLKDAKKAFEKEFIRLKLAQHENNISKTAKTVGVNRSYLHKLIKRTMPKQKAVGEK
jgi:two-component system nitrogen regulation response regulator NtrX